MNTFRYELSGLQRVQDYRIDRLAADLAEAKEKIKKQQSVIDDLDQQIQDHEQRLTQLIYEQPLFWVEARELSAAYLAELRAERTKQQQLLERLNADAERLMADLLENRKARTLLEKHRMRRLEVHVRNEEKVQGKLVDEQTLRSYLSRRI